MTPACPRVLAQAEGLKKEVEEGRVRGGEEGGRGEEGGEGLLRRSSSGRKAGGSRSPGTGHPQVG